MSLTLHRLITLGFAAINFAFTLCTVGGWMHLWGFTDTWQYQAASYAAVLGGLVSALSLLRRVLRARRDAENARLGRYI